MLTNRHMEARKAWAQTYLNKLWNKTIFTDETAFDLFRNKVSRWHNQKIMAWGWNFFKRQDSFVLLHRHYGRAFFCEHLKTQLIPSAK